MIEFNLIIPMGDREKILSLRSDIFRIISGSPTKGGQYFLIEAAEEEMLVLTLKYGPKNVWKR